MPALPVRFKTLDPRAKAAILLLIVAGGAVVSAVWAGHDLLHPLALGARIGDLLANAGPWAPMVFIAFFAASPFLFLPAIPLTIAGGALFGPVLGAVYSLAGATLGAALSFLVGRVLGHDEVAAHAHGRLATVKAGIDAEGWRFVAFLRLVPVLPFGIANMMLGATDIGFGTYIVTTLITMAPGAAIYAYVGSAGRAAASGAAGLVARAGIALGLLVLITGIPAAIRYARMRKKTEAVKP